MKPKISKYTETTYRVDGDTLTATQDPKNEVSIRRKTLGPVIAKVSVSELGELIDILSALEEQNE